MKTRTGVAHIIRILGSMLVCTAVLSGCGNLEFNIKTVFNSNGSCERILHLVADGIFVEPLSDRSVDQEAKRDGWTVQTYNEGSRLHKVFTRKFADATNMGSSTPLLLGQGKGMPGGFGQFAPNVKLSISSRFPYKYYRYEEVIQPSAEPNRDVCSACDGRGGETCSLCGGRGRDTCSACDGSGVVQILDESMRCPACDGVGSTPCMACSGTGRTVCFACGGSGRPGEMERSMEKTAESMFSFRNEIVLPGEVISTNSDRRSGKSLVWDITFERMKNGISMQAISRELNMGAIRALVIVSLLVSGVIVGIVVNRRQPRGDLGIELRRE